ncbi:MAG: hypothetical protein ACI9IV_001390 [Paracoccaceae bacterium]|jgi:uncharacterized protein YhfF
MTQTPPSLQQLVDQNPDAETFRFGDDARLCARITDLVRTGRKTATCEALRVYQGGEDEMPAVGRRDIALNWDGTPALMLETVEVSTRAFNGMDAEFVAAQGEFRDLAHWKKEYIAYFKRSGGFDPAMELMCERFRVVADYAK